MHLLPTVGHPQATVVPRPAPAWGTVLFDESRVNRGPDDLAGGDGQSVELIEARNQSWNPRTLLDFSGCTGCLAGATPTNNR